MALVKRAEFLQSLKESGLQGEQGDAPESRIYLFHGERYLCREAADLLEKQLLADKPGAVHSIDGDNEDPGQTLARLVSFSLLPGRQIYRVTDTRIFHSKNVLDSLWKKAEQNYSSGKPDRSLKYLFAMLDGAGVDEALPDLAGMSADEWKKCFSFGRPEGDLSWADRLLEGAAANGVTRGKKGGKSGDISERYVEAIKKGLPPQNILILTAETVDKRQKLYTQLKKLATIVDCTVAVGASSAAQTEQKEVLREVMLRTLGEFHKKIDQRAVELFFERVGFHPVAVAMESEKLAHYVGDRDAITAQDLDEMVCRNREDALFELTDAFSKRQLGRTLTILSRLLDHGVHSLAVLSTLRNYLRKQLLFRAIQLQPSPAWRHGMNAREFQNQYLPALKEDERYKELLGGHPYALFVNFTKASEYSSAGLRRWLSMVLNAEFRLKGSPLPQRLVLEEMFITMLKGAPRRSPQPQKVIP